MPSDPNDLNTLGASLGKYGENPLRQQLGVMNVVACGCSAFFLLLALAPLAPQQEIVGRIVALGAAALCGLAASLGGWLSSSWRGASAYLFEQGFVLTREGVTTVARWDEIAKVRQRITPLLHRRIALVTSYTYTVTLASGQIVHFDQALHQIAEVGKILQRMTTRALLPVALAAYERGASVPFGRFSVTQWGIADGQQTLLWRDLRRVSFEAGVLTIMHSGSRRPWATASVADIPNIYVFTALISSVPRYMA